MVRLVLADAQWAKMEVYCLSCLLPIDSSPPGEPGARCTEGYPAETTEAFCDGHVRAFAFFGGVPQSILYDNTRIAVARILGDGKRQRTRQFLRRSL